MGRESPYVAALSVDCADASALIDFYRDLLDGELVWRNDDSAAVRVGRLTLIAQRVADYEPPRWPGSPIVHLDLGVRSELSEAVSRALGLGAIEASFQPDLRWRVLLDPAGHPFCLTTVTPPP